jgi:D-alanyl-lipoteichoic acid acyltransferase DltB (MBOAT superfamily)
LGQGGWRIALGFLKKFIIADTMAQGLSLTPANAAQADSIAFLWVLLYGYAVRLYLDFAGYTDIAIGIGILYGIRLPENFDRPYLKSNIAEFWQSWHITLSNWVRFYVFSPLSRWLLTRKWRPSSTVIVLFSQLATMVVIGLWHGITWNFFIWGLWHGIGLFVHKQWSDRTRKWYRRLGQHPWRERAWTVFAWFLTFNFVVLGWVWFALPSLQLSIEVFLGLFGFGT